MDRQISERDRTLIVEMQAAGCEVLVMEERATGRYRTVCRDQDNHQYRVYSDDGPDFEGIHALWKERTATSPPAIKRLF